MGKTYIEPFKITNEVFNDIRGVFSPFNFAKDFSDFNIYQLNTVITKKPKRKLPKQRADFLA